MGMVVETCQPVLINDYPHWSNRSEVHREGPWQAFLAVPLMIGGQLVGAIGIVQTEPGRKFSLSDQRLLNLYAQQAAVAIRNARLYQAAKEAAARRSVLHQVSQQIVAASLDPEEIYEAIHQAASKLMPTEAFVITLLNEAKSVIEAVYLVDRLGRAPCTHVAVDEGLSGRVIATGTTLYIRDMLVELQKPGSEQIESVHFGDPEEVRSILAVPMRLGGKVVGMLSAQSYEPDAYSTEDQYLLEMLASYAAISLDNARLFKEVQRLAITDALTEVNNRRQLFELGQREFNRACRFERPLSAIMLDVDHFKRVNDRLGHAAGDQVLFLLAQGLQQNIRDIDILGRYGGEEFVVLLPETSLPEAMEAAERLRAQVEGALAQSEYGWLAITISMGVACLSPGIQDLSFLIAHADQAMYDAKNAGRNRVASRQIGGYTSS